jgi:hydrogenase small subunit
MAPDEPIMEHMRRAGVDRRTVLRWSAYMAGVLALPAIPFAARIAEALETQPRLPVLWLNGQDCTGDAEGFLRASQPTPADLILDRLSLNYSELLMAGSGEAAERSLADTISNDAGQYVIVVEGSIPTAQNGVYCCIGGRSFTEILRQAAASALGVIAVGTCATNGGLPAAGGGSTGASSVRDVLGSTSVPIVALPGCPMNVENLTATLVNYLTLGEWPALDSSGRPTFAYGRRVHQDCERREHFQAGRFVKVIGDEGYQAGWCLRDVGCQGPQTYANCPVKRFNSATSWPVASGSPCMSCTTGGFWDRLDRVFSWTVPTTTSTAVGDLATAETK